MVYTHVYTYVYTIQFPLIPVRGHDIAIVIFYEQ